MLHLNAKSRKAGAWNIRVSAAARLNRCSRSVNNVNNEYLKIVATFCKESGGLWERAFLVSFRIGGWC